MMQARVKVPRDDKENAVQHHIILKFMENNNGDLRDT